MVNLIGMKHSFGLNMTGKSTYKYQQHHLRVMVVVLWSITDVRTRTSKRSRFVLGKFMLKNYNTKAIQLHNKSKRNGNKEVFKMWMYEVA